MDEGVGALALVRAHEHVHGLQHVGDVVQAAPLHAQQRAGRVQPDRRAGRQAAVLRQELVAQHAERALAPRARARRRARPRRGLPPAHRRLRPRQTQCEQPGCTPPPCRKTAVGGAVCAQSWLRRRSRPPAHRAEADSGRQGLSDAPTACGPPTRQARTNGAQSPPARSAIAPAPNLKRRAQSADWSAWSA